MHAVFKRIDEMNKVVVLQKQPQASDYYDPFFLPAGATAFKRDMPDAVVRFLDTLLGRDFLEVPEAAAVKRGGADRKWRGVCGPKVARKRRISGACVVCKCMTLINWL